MNTTATKTVLVVEDDRKISDLLVNYLQTNGYEATAVYDGINAVRIIKYRTPHIVILDWMLPGMDGLSLCKEVRTFSGSLSKAKVIAYLYQQSETVIMDYIHGEIESRGITVIARVHDAIFVKNRLGERKEEIEYLLQSNTENKYWHLTMKELEPFNRPYCLDKAEIDAHRLRIAEEERHAKSVAQSQSINKSWNLAIN